MQAIEQRRTRQRRREIRLHRIYAGELVTIQYVLRRALLDRKSQIVMWYVDLEGLDDDGLPFELASQLLWNALKQWVGGYTHYICYFRLTILKFMEVLYVKLYVERKANQYNISEEGFKNKIGDDRSTLLTDSNHTGKSRKFEFSEKYLVIIH